MGRHFCPTCMSTIQVSKNCGIYLEKAKWLAWLKRHRINEKSSTSTRGMIIYIPPSSSTAVWNFFIPGSKSPTWFARWDQNLQLRPKKSFPPVWTSSRRAWKSARQLWGSQSVTATRVNAVVLRSQPNLLTLTICCEENVQKCNFLTCSTSLQSMRRLQVLRGAACQDPRPKMRAEIELTVRYTNMSEILFLALWYCFIFPSAHSSSFTLWMDSVESGAKAFMPSYNWTVVPFHNTCQINYSAPRELPRSPGAYKVINEWSCRTQCWIIIITRLFVFTPTLALICSQNMEPHDQCTKDLSLQCIAMVYPHVLANW